MSRALSKEDARAFVSKQSNRDAAESLIAIVRDGLKKAAGLLVKPDEPGYNPDASVPWSEATTSTRFAIEIFKAASADRREAHVTERTLGVLLIKERMKEDDWEAHAKEVDESEQKKRAQEFIDAAVVDGE